MRSIALAVALFVVALLACAGEAPETCGAIGRVASCPCPGGAQGAQECGPAGVWGACICPGADAGPEVGDAPPPPLDGPTGPEAGADATEVAADVPTPPDGPPEAAVDARPDGPLVCAAPEADCDRQEANGCEVNTGADPMNCGGCGRRCLGIHVARNGCEGGSCSIVSCEPSFGDCDRNVENGCETNIRETVAHCGACGARCEAPNRAVTCVGGVCVPGACVAPFVDCDGEPANGCETNPRTSPVHCSRCNNPCDAPRACVNGSCVMP
jgi:hypothetical protein